MPLLFRKLYHPPRPWKHEVHNILRLRSTSESSMPGQRWLWRSNPCVRGKHYVLCITQWYEHATLPIQNRSAWNEGYPNTFISHKTCTKRLYFLILLFPFLPFLRPSSPHLHRPAHSFRKLADSRACKLLTSRQNAPFLKRTRIQHRTRMFQMRNNLFNKMN